MFLKSSENYVLAFPILSSCFMKGRKFHACEKREIFLGFFKTFFLLNCFVLESILELLSSWFCSIRLSLGKGNKVKSASRVRAKWPIRPALMD